MHKLLIDSRFLNLCPGPFSVLSLFFLSVFISCGNDNSIGVPELETAAVEIITSATAISGGIIKKEGGSEILEKGVCWGPESNPTVAGSHTLDGDGSSDFISRLTSLLPHTTYHVRAYAVNGNGIGYGDNKEFKTLSADGYMQIIADHTVVDQFNQIPSQFLQEVKKMWIVLAGESHAEAHMTGLSDLESNFPEFAVNVTNYGNPEGFGTSHLRVSTATWGDVGLPSGWVYGYGEEDWCVYKDPPTFEYNQNAVLRTKAGITYCNTHNLSISAFGFIWCYDTEVNIPDYLRATQEYVDYCILKGYPTKVYFTTGPVDDYLAIGQNAWDNHLRWEEVREYVKKDPTLILLDYADILSYDNNGQVETTTWNGHIVPIIHPSNAKPDQTGHISNNGALRLAKAVWWMLARMAGWDGQSQ